VPALLAAWGLTDPRTILTSWAVDPLVVVGLGFALWWYGRALRRLQRWRDEATKAGRTVRRIAVAFEAGRDGFWLARWLRARDIEAHVIHASSVAVSREHRRAKTDRLDVELLKRALLGWLRGERDHCKMAAIPTLELEDARRPSR